MNLKTTYRKRIGLDDVLEKVNTLTPFGNQRKRTYKTFQPGEEAALEEEFEEIERCMELLRHGGLREVMHLFCLLKDISGALNHLEGDQELDEVEFFEIKLFAAYSQRIRQQVKGVGLRIDLVDLSAVFGLLDPEDTGLMTFHYYDAYSPKLRLLRAAKRELDRRGLREAGCAMEVQRLSEELEEVTWTVRRELGATLKTWREDLLHNMRELGILDHRIAKADHARKQSCVRPKIASSPCLCLTDMIHPTVDAVLQAKGKRMEPLSLSLTPGSAILTGANMGGKSVTLKTLLLQMELFRMGYFLPCREASLKLVDFVHFSAEDGEDIHRGLSSFGMEVLTLQEILKRSDRGIGLIVLDEPARGTNPQEARAIVKATCRHFKAGDDYFFVATHLPDIPEEGMRHFQIMGLKQPLNETSEHWSSREPMEAIAALERNMDHRIREVSSQTKVPQEALHVMAFLGTDPGFIREIKQILGEDYE